MKHYQAILQYDGTDRHGFQVQEGKQTIQGDLNRVLSQLLRGPVSTRAASRTDIGVHAFGQVVKITTEAEGPLDLQRFSSALPSHIRCLDLSPCAEDFIPSMDQSSKEYRYLFAESGGRYIAPAPGHLDFEHVQACIELLKGRNDFRNFYSLSGNASTTLRDILECDLTLINPQELFRESLFSTELTSAWQFRIVGTGFLKHMVRHLVGALWLVGQGTLSVDDFARYLQGPQQQWRPWKKADPRGLYLLKVSYE